MHALWTLSVLTCRHVWKYPPDFKVGEQRKNLCMWRSSPQKNVEGRKCRIEFTPYCKMVWRVAPNFYFILCFLPINWNMKSIRPGTIVSSVCFSADSKFKGPIKDFFSSSSSFFFFSFYFFIASRLWAYPYTPWSAWTHRHCSPIKFCGFSSPDSKMKVHLRYFFYSALPPPPTLEKKLWEGLRTKESIVLRLSFARKTVQCVTKVFGKHLLPLQMQKFNMITQVGQRATRSAALLVDLCWTYSAPWKCALILDLF